MAITRPKISSVVPAQLPEFVRDDYQTFVDFLKAYYEFLETTQQDLVTLRDIDTTLDSFITYFKDDLAQKLPYSTVDERFLLTHIKDMYLAKGSESSFRLLFRILFNKEIEIDYPAKQMLRASDGKWNQDVSVFIKILVGDPQSIVGKLVDVVTTTKVIRVLVDRRQYVEVEVDRAIRISDDVYEFILDRRFFGTISVGDTLRYLDSNNNLVFNGVILPTTSNLIIEKPGTGFKVGDLYNIINFNGYGTIMKVAAVNADGGIKQGQFIKYGTGYTTDFTTTITSQKGQDLSSQSGTIIQRVDSFLAPANKSVALSISEGMSGFQESGSINTADYNIDPSGSNAIDGTYAGLTIREFGISSVDSQVTSTEPAIIKVSLGPLAKYPGYYVNNDGFLDDAIFIQDSRYYQAFSYVIKIDQALDTYKTIVKNLIHPSGMAIFGEYDLRNELRITTSLESLIKILSITANDEVTSVAGLEIKDVEKIINSVEYDHYLNNGITLDSDLTYPIDTAGTLLNRTVPYISMAKPLADEESPEDSGGIILLNPYVEAGWFLNDSGSYVGEPSTFTG